MVSGGTPGTHRPPETHGSCGTGVGRCVFLMALCRGFLVRPQSPPKSSGTDRPLGTHGLGGTGVGRCVSLMALCSGFSVRPQSPPKSSGSHGTHRRPETHGSGGTGVRHSASLMALWSGFLVSPQCPPKSSVSMDQTIAPARPLDKANATCVARVTVNTVLTTRLVRASGVLSPLLPSVTDNLKNEGRVESRESYYRSQ